MHVNEDGRVSGSIDRAQLAELYAKTKDAELRAHYEDVDPGIKDYVDSLTAPAEEPPAEEQAEPVKKAAAKKTATKEAPGGHDH